MILLLDNFDSFTFNLYQMLQAETSIEVVVHRNNALTLDEIKKLNPAGIVISPGPGHPANPADVGVCAEVLGNITCPVLGVCLGHQLIAHHFGADIIHAPSVMHGKTSPVTLKQSSPLFDEMPSQFDVMRYHSLTVSRENFPADLEITAVTDDVIMALQHKTLPVYGVQFHPESIGTPQGTQLLKNFTRLLPRIGPSRTAQPKSAFSLP